MGSGEGRWSFKRSSVAFKSLKWKTSYRFCCLALANGFGVISKRAVLRAHAEGTSGDGEPLHGIYLVVSSF